MYFIRKKKHQRDQEAGLIFHWRGFRKHHLGKFIALMMACLFFAFSVYAIRIEGIKAPLVSKQEGVVIMLDEDNPHCQSLLLEVEERSPFPVRWDPVTDKDVLLRVDEEKGLLQGELWNYEMRLEPLPEKKSSQLLTSIVDSYDEMRGAAYRGRWRQSAAAGGIMEPGDLWIRARLEVSGDLESRIPEPEMVMPGDLISDDGYGQVYRFQLGLDESGAVTTCIPLPGGTTDITKITSRQKILAAWLRAQRFQPADEETSGVATGQLELQIEALRQ